MSSLKDLERKVDLLIDYITCPEYVGRPEESFKRRSAIISELLNLRNKVSAMSSDQSTVNPKSVKGVTEDLLTEMGIPSHLNGYRYLTSAVCMIIESPEVSTNVHKVLYPDIALEHNSTPTRVERSIRHSIEVCFNRNDYEVVSSYFGSSLSPDRAKATNTEFIFRIVQLVERRMEE